MKSRAAAVQKGVSPARPYFAGFKQQAKGANKEAKARGQQDAHGHSGGYETRKAGQGRDLLF